jgi:hypothetical protein
MFPMPPLELLVLPPLDPHPASVNTASVATTAAIRFIFIVNTPSYGVGRSDFGLLSEATLPDSDNFAWMLRVKRTPPDSNNPFKNQGAKFQTRGYVGSYEIQSELIQGQAKR